MRPPCPSASSQPAGRIIWAPRQASERRPCAPAFVQRARNTGQRSSIQLSLNGPTEIGGAGQLTLVATREQLDTTMLGSALPMVPCFGLERLLFSRESARRVVSADPPTRHIEADPGNQPAPASSRRAPDKPRGRRAPRSASLRPDRDRFHRAFLSPISCRLLPICVPQVYPGEFH